MITYDFFLDMTPGGKRPVLYLSQYDDDFTLIAHLFARAGTFTVEAGTTAQIRGTKADGNGYSATATVDVDNKTVTVTGAKQMTAAAGKGAFEISLSKDGQELNTANFTIEVEKSPLDRDTISASEIKEFVYTYDRIDELKSAANTITHSIDNTLTKSGKAADAGATGAAVESLQEQIDTLNDGGLNISQETVAQQVTEWLDEHPEATTTVDDGSLTDKKLTAAERKRRMLFFDTVEELKAADLIEGQWVHVSGICYPAYDGKDLDFRITTDNNHFNIPLNNGLYAECYHEMIEPAPYTPETAYRILKCGASYFDRDNLTYPPATQTTYGSIFAEEILQDGSGNYFMDCSTFAQACIQGISYENSRFVLGQTEKNNPAPWGFTWPHGLPVSEEQEARTRGFLACEMAFYSYIHGWLFEIKEDASNLRPGDMVFTQYTDGTRDTVWNKIGHVQIVFDKISQFDDGVRVIEAGHGNRPVDDHGSHVVHCSAYVAGTNTPAKWAARFPIQASAEFKDITRLRNRLTFPFTLTGSPEAKSEVIYTTEKFKAGEIYTMVVKGDLSKLQGGFYPYLKLVKVGGQHIYNVLTHGSSMNAAANTMYFVFTPYRTTNTAEIYNAIKFCFNQRRNQGELTLNIDDIKIYRGLYVGETQNHEHNANITLKSEVLNATYLRAQEGNRLQFDGRINISSTGDLEIGEIDLYSYGDRMWPVVVHDVNWSSDGKYAVSAMLIQRYDSTTDTNKLILRILSNLNVTLKTIRIAFDIDFS